MLSFEKLDAEWTAALAHAGIPSDCVRVYTCKGAAATDGSHAVWHPPGRPINRGPHFPKGLSLGHANAPDNLGLHRIVIWLDDSAPVIGARLRHELEHARQWDAPDGDATFALYDLIRDGVLRQKPGGLTGAVLNSIPAEQDCNAAAAVFLRQRHPDAIPAILASDNNHLASSQTGPEPLATLPARMVAFLARHPDLCAAYAATQQASLTFPDLLEWRWTGASDVWRTLASADPG